MLYFGVPEVSVYPETSSVVSWAFLLSAAASAMISPARGKTLLTPVMLKETGDAGQAGHSTVRRSKILQPIMTAMSRPGWSAPPACFAHRAGWLPAFERIAILRRLARLVERDFEIFALLIAREGGKPLIDARIETARAVNGIEGAAGEIEHLAGREIPMGTDFRQPEPLGVHHQGTRSASLRQFPPSTTPLNLIVHQVVPAIATGCPVIIKPAATHALDLPAFRPAGA